MSKRSLLLRLGALLLWVMVPIACTRDAPHPVEPTPIPVARVAVEGDPATDPISVAARKDIASYRITSPPVFDGDLGDWSDKGRITLDANTAAFAVGEIANPADLSAQIRSRWDSEYLYFGIRVWDDRVLNDSGSQVWHDDSIEIGLDGANDDNAYGSDDHQYTVRHDGYVTDRGRTDEEAVGNLEMRIGWRSDGYIIELRIPMSELGNKPVQVGRQIGFTVGLHDDDNGSRYDAYLIWEGNNTYNGAATFGTLALVSSGPVPTDTPTITPWPTRTQTPATTGTPPTPSNTPRPTQTARPTRTGTVTPTGTPTPGAIAINPEADTFITSWDPNGNYGQHYSARIRPNEMSVLMRFNLEAIPETATVLEAILRIYVVQAGYHDLPVEAYHLLQPWNASEANFFRPRTGARWGIAGCREVGVDHVSNPGGRATLREANVYVDIPITDLAQRWVSNPNRNFGTVLHGAGGVATEYSIVTTDNLLTQLRPQLILTWAQLTPTITPTGTPTPTSSGTPSDTPTPTNTPLPSATPTITPGLETRLSALREQIHTLEGELDRLLTVLKLVAETPTPTLPPGWPTRTPSPTATNTPILPPEDEAVALERRVKELEALIRQMEEVIGQFGKLP